MRLLTCKQSVMLKAMALSMLLAPLCIQADDKTEEAVPTPRFEYKFKQTETPHKLVLGNNVLNSIANNGIYSTRGHCYATLGRRVTDAAISPIIGRSVLVSTNFRKDGRNEAAIFSSRKDNIKLHGFKNKEFGNPFSVTTTADGRRVLLATDKGLQDFDIRTYELKSTMPLAFNPSDVVISDNGYYLAIFAGNRVAVYNYEDKVLRNEFSFGSNVTDLFFNDDNTLMGVLTNDGMLSVYDTRTFIVKYMVEDLGEGIGAAFNPDSKYVIALTSPTQMTVVNLIDDAAERDVIDLPETNATDFELLVDEYQSCLACYTSDKMVGARRITKLSPYFGKLVKNGAQKILDSWLERMPGESMEEYRQRVNDKTRSEMLRKYEDDIATSLAGDLVSMAVVSLGKYDRGAGVVEVDFDNMPSIYLPVDEADLGAFNSGGDLQFRNARYGILDNDHFELIYAEVVNSNNGKTYIYDNTNRVYLNFLTNEEDAVSIELIQQQQMEEVKLQEIREKVIEEAKSRNVISNHTNITVDSRIASDYNANGERIINYIVKFSYEVEPAFTAHEDFPPGKYHIEESGAASSMVTLVKEVFENDFKQYIRPGQKMQVKLYGTADATPIVGRIVYDGSYGDFVDEPIHQDGELKVITVTKNGLVQLNEQLAFLRALGCQDYLMKNVSGFKELNTDFDYNIDVSADKGSEYRRITAEFTIFDAIK